MQTEHRHITSSCSPAQDDHGTLRYLDTSIGQPVAELRTKLGALKTIAQNPYNAVVQLGHYNGELGRVVCSLSGLVMCVAMQGQ